MKVFISWSGEKSHKIGIILRDWLPSVIQSIVPYVSSEDIDKGARWSSDIAKELADSTFGILCVTKENLNAPWLCFEAGALSKTVEKAYVTPFLFDVKRSEVDGPILQFQSTIFEKEDIKKLINTLNKACGESSIPQERLDRTFEVWYPTLEADLRKVSEDHEVLLEKEETSPSSSDILEEILDISRENQKLLRNPNSEIFDAISDISNKVSNSWAIYENNIDERHISQKRKIMIYDDFIHDFIHIARTHYNKTYGFLLMLSVFKDDFPWIYDMGKELMDILKSNEPVESKKEALYGFRELLDYTIGHPVIRETFGRRKEYMVFYKEMPYILMQYLDELI
ncbi:MAG: hypothetical protein IJZ89_09035 [Clostridia bacterium]|nr:hypothetical protein [Clostridia bacterium]